jgi:hypothetical protein
MPYRFRTGYYFLVKFHETGDRYRTEPYFASSETAAKREALKSFPASHWSMIPDGTIVEDTMKSLFKTKKPIRRW